MKQFFIVLGVCSYHGDSCMLVFCRGVLVVFTCLFATFLCAADNVDVSDPEQLWIATPLTKEKSFTLGIEGPACDRQGNVYAVCYEKDQTIGKIAPKWQGRIMGHAYQRQCRQRNCVRQIGVDVCGGLRCTQRVAD